MLFNSFAFAIFLPVVFILYWALPKKCQWAVILVSSYYFYMSWNVKYVFHSSDNRCFLYNSDLA